jgi:predicted RNase H-like HicB family nuclease
MNQIIFDVEEVEDGVYVAEAYLSEAEQIVTQGANISELKIMIKEALECHFDDPTDIPHEVILNFKQVVFAV